MPVGFTHHIFIRMLTVTFDFLNFTQIILLLQQKIRDNYFLYA